MRRDAVLSEPYGTRAAVADDLVLLDRNEGPEPPAALLASLAGGAGVEQLRRYPDGAPLEAALAARFGVDRSRVLVTAGADDVIDRCCRAWLAAGGRIVYPTPTFEMIERYAALAGAAAVTVPWTGGAFPLAELEALLDDVTGLVAVVSPNNPTGAAIDAATLAAIAAAAPGMVLLDHAYVEYADEDLTQAALALPNVVVARTLSKAWGLAGCRVGYALGSPEAIATLRAAGAPYPVAAPSLALAAERLATGEGDLVRHVAQVCDERERLAGALAEWGVSARPSQASFLLVELGDRAPFVHAALCAQGFLVRDFSARPATRGALRVSLPGDEAVFERFVAALGLAVAPEALLFDMDGVLADTRESYDACITWTASSFGVAVTPDEIAAARAAGDAANDWVTTRRLVGAAGVAASLEAVTARFQEYYLGTDGVDGLRQRERPLLSPAVIGALAERYRLAIVTGRPRDEAEHFLVASGMAGAVSALVTMHETPAKPSPEPVRLALERLGVSRAWYVGDTPDDMRAAVAAGVLPVGVVPPGGPRGTWTQTLQDAGAAWTLPGIDAITEVLR